MSTDQQPAKPVTGRILITGASGFVGSNIRRELAGRPLRLLVRNANEVPGSFGDDVEVVEGDLTNPASLTGKFDGCEAVIHLVAIISEGGGQTFDGVIRQGTVNAVNEAQRAGVSRFLDMSALGTRNDKAFPYFEAKYQAEQAVKESGIPWTIFRPSVIFGPGDEFINTLANLVKKAPILPVVGDGKSKFQPVHVTEVATAFRVALDDPSTAYHTYDLGGPDILTYEGMMDTIATQLGKSPSKIHVPIGLMKTVVSLSSPLPSALKPPVTMEQLRMLAVDNCSAESATATLIGREPMRLADGIGYINA